MNLHVDVARVKEAVTNFKNGVSQFKRVEDMAWDLLTALQKLEQEESLNISYIEEPKWCSYCNRPAQYDVVFSKLKYISDSVPRPAYLCSPLRHEGTGDIETIKMIRRRK